jgi:Acetyltransferase (GNAT) domain
LVVANFLNSYRTTGSEIVKACGKDIVVKGRFVRIAQIDGDKYNFPDDPEALIDELKASGERIDLFTFIQKLPETNPKYAYPFEWDNLAVLPISTFDHWWNHQIRSFPRNRARQAEKKGVVLREIACDEALAEGICAIYNESPVRQGKRFPHYGMTLESARDYARTFPDRSIFVGAFVGDTLIGFIKLVMDESRTHACMVHILSMIKHRDKAPTNALLSQAVKTCAQRGVSYLVYENFAYGRKQGDSLSRFKEVNGFERMNLPRYYIPLTPLGRVAFRCGLHHQLKDHLPESLVAKFRELRTAWYERRFQLKEQSS